MAAPSCTIEEIRDEPDPKQYESGLAHILDAHDGKGSTLTEQGICLQCHLSAFWRRGGDPASFWACMSLYSARDRGCLQVPSHHHGLPKTHVQFL